MTAKVTAWKRHGERHLTHCGIDDEEAIKFEVSYSGMVYQCCTLDFDNLFQAQRVVSALNNSFEAGKVAKLAELRNFLGV